MITGIDDRVLKCSVEMALQMLNYNSTKPAIVTAVSNPAMHLIIDQVLQALSGSKCWATLPKLTDQSKSVYAQMARFYKALCDNPAGASIDILVVVMGLVAAYVLVKFLRPKVAEWALKLFPGKKLCK